MSNTSRKYIFTEYHPSITQYLNDLDFDLSMPLKDISIGAIRFPIYGLKLIVQFDLSKSMKVKC